MTVCPLLHRSFLHTASPRLPRLCCPGAGFAKIHIILEAVWNREVGLLAKDAQNEGPMCCDNCLTARLASCLITGAAVLIATLHTT
jgi:hypothetical protein